MIRTKTVDVRGSVAQRFVVLIATTKANRRLVVDLGDAAAFAEIGVEAGDHIEAEGRVVRIHGRSMLVPDPHESNGKVVQLICRGRGEASELIGA